MSKNFKLDEINFAASIEELDHEVSGPTGNILRKFVIEAFVIGEGILNNINHVLARKIVTLEIPDDGLQLRVKIGDHSTHYQSPLKQKTEIRLNIELSERDKDLPDDHSFATQTAIETTTNNIGIETIVQLLVNSGIFTKEQFNKKFDELLETEREAMKISTYGIGKNTDIAEEE